VAVVAVALITTSGILHIKHDPHPAPATPCVAAPSTCGFPDATTTGPHPGIVLQPSGSVVVLTAGTVLRAMDIHGSLRISASHVTVSDVRVTCDAHCRSTFVVRVDRGVSGVHLDNMDIGGAAGKTGVGGGGSYRLQSSDVHDVSDGLHAVSGTWIRNNYVHDLAPTPTSHSDTIQLINPTSTGISIIHNTLLPWNSRTSVFNDAAIICGNQCRQTNGLSVFDNLMNGGSQTLKCPTIGVSGNTYRRNRFGRNYLYAPTTGCATPGNSFDDSNIWDDTQLPVPTRPVHH
jgi:hypothetical protein